MSLQQITIPDNYTNYPLKDKARTITRFFQKAEAGQNDACSSLLNPLPESWLYPCTILVLNGEIELTSSFVNPIILSASILSFLAAVAVNAVTLTVDGTRLWTSLILDRTIWNVSLL